MPNTIPNFDESTGRGRCENQRLKAFLVREYLMRETDENNPKTADEIVAYLSELGVSAERRGIYKDIAEINKVQLILDDTVETIQEAEELLAEDEEQALIRSGKRGFFAQRSDSADRIRLLAECVYAAKFITDKQAEDLTAILFKMISQKQADAIRHDAIVVGRVKTDNMEVYNTVSIIHEAMSREIEGKKHIPEKIAFNYLHRSISDMKQTVSRKGEKYIVSPYQMLIVDGNYYLLAYHDDKEKIMTYRVDRMKKIERLGIARSGEAAFAALDMSTYTQRIFSMYEGEKKRVSMRFITPLLDTMVDRFGTKNVVYGKIDDSHCRIAVDVEISDQFFGWLCGFGSRVVIETQDVAAKYAAYLKKITRLYENTDK